MKAVLCAIAASLVLVASFPAAPVATRDALFFCEQRAGRVGYIGWPPIGCTTDNDCKHVNGSYCMNDKTKTAPYFCHEPEVFLVTGKAKPVGLAMDTSTMEIFYDEDDQSAGLTSWPLSSVDVYGQKKAEVVPKLVDPQGIDVDTQNKQVYYTEHKGQRIGVVGYDGKGQKVLHQFTGPNMPSDVKVDIENGKVFAMTEGTLSTDGAIVSMELDGSNVTTLASGVVRAYGLTLDIANKVIYYISGGHGGFIGKMNYDGSKPSKVLDGLDWPYMLDYDPTRKLLVFSTTGVGDGVIRTCTPEGLNVTETLALGFAPMGVTFGKVPLN